MKSKRKSVLTLTLALLFVAMFTTSVFATYTQTYGDWNFTLLSSKTKTRVCDSMINDVHTDTVKLEVDKISGSGTVYFDIIWQNPSSMPSKLGTFTLSGSSAPGRYTYNLHSLIDTIPMPDMAEISVTVRGSGSSSGQLYITDMY